MNPVEAVSACFKKYATFSGRSPRSEFWWFYLFYILVIGFGTQISEFFGLAFLVLIIPLVAVGIRRMHDTDHSGWWLIAPIVNIVFACTPGTNGANRFGDITSDV